MKHLNKLPKLLLSTAITSCLAFSVQSTMAAVVPAGTQLAKQQQLIWNIGSNPASLDPQKIEGTVEGDFVNQLFEALVLSDSKGNIIPGVATSWEHSPDYKTWTFHLRHNAKWSNGDPVTAQDFVYAWRRLADPKTASPYSSYLNFLKLENSDDVINGKKPLSALGIEAKDPYTLVLHLSEGVPYADKLTSLYVLAPVNKKIVEKYGDAWTKPENIVGNGAFKLKSATINEKYVLERNPYYWDNSHTVLNSVILLPIQSSATSYARYRAGENDISGIPLEDWENIKKKYKDQVHISPKLCTVYYAINVQKPYLSDPRVRKALALAFQPEIITDKILRQGQTPAYQFTPTSIATGEKIKPAEWKNWSRTKRDAEAIKLLKEAGYDQNHPLSLTLLYTTSDNVKKLVIATDSFWKKNLKGAVKIKLENQEWKTFLDTRRQGNYDIANAGWCADYNEASTFLNVLLSNSSNNTMNWHNQTYDNLIEQAYKAPTEEKRAELYAKAAQLINQDLPLIPIYHAVGVSLIKPYVKGFNVNNPLASYYLKDVYIVKH